MSRSRGAEVRSRMSALHSLEEFDDQKPSHGGCVHQYSTLCTQSQLDAQNHNGSSPLCFQSLKAFKLCSVSESFQPKELLLHVHVYNICTCARMYSVHVHDEEAQEYF